MYQIYYYRVYETGGEINLDQLERDLGRAHDISRSRFARLAPKSIRMEQPPLQLTVGTALAGNGGPELQLTVRAKIFDIGAISLCLAAERHDDRLLDIAVSSAEDGWLEEQFAQGLALVRGILEPCLGDLQVDIDFYEDFTVYVVDSPALVQDPVAVLMGEHGPFSQQVREQVLRNTLSYTLDDYAILSWDSALLCDREPPVDLIELIEFANVQLLELRYYDRLLGAHMTKMYEDIKSVDRSGYRPPRRYRAIMSQLMETIADVTEVTEKIVNLIKITEDIYYARVYDQCLKVLRVQNWIDSVNRKISVLQQNYSMLSNEVNIQHSNFLEWIIIILIAMEFALAIWQSL